LSFVTRRHVVLQKFTEISEERAVWINGVFDYPDDVGSRSLPDYTALRIRLQHTSSHCQENPRISLTSALLKNIFKVERGK